MKSKMIFGIIIIAGLPVLTALCLLGYLQFTEYNPAPIELVSTTGKGKPLPFDKIEFSFITWNIGYAGLGEEMDFFYEGGKKVRSDKQYMDNCLKGICTLLKTEDTLDFIFLQEIDRRSKRTYKKDQLEDICKALPAYCSIFTPNYKVEYIPVPLYEPTGKVTSGLCTFSKHPPESNERHGYNAYFSWPKRLLWLKRCFLVSSFTFNGGKQLIVVNLHNSAYDDTGELRAKELEILKTYLLREYQKGNYIIIGGDWNMNPKGFRMQEIKSGDKVYSIRSSMNETFMPGWETVYDSLLPTNRNLDIPYKKGLTGTTVIDFYVISPNVELLKCFTLDEGFRYADHNPVFAKFRLRNEIPGFSVY